MRSPARTPWVGTMPSRHSERQPGYLRRELPNHSVAPTALVHEASLRLVDQRRVRWENRRHVFGIAAQAMRRILVDRARAQKAVKRGAGELSVEPDGRDAPQLPPDVDVLALDEALSRLEALESRWRRLVELRFRWIDRWLVLPIDSPGQLFPHGADFRYAKLASDVQDLMVIENFR
jgi:hypothetical protein